MLMMDSKHMLWVVGGKLRVEEVEALGHLSICPDTDLSALPVESYGALTRCECWAQASLSQWEADECGLGRHAPRC